MWIAAFWLGLGLFDGAQTVIIMRSEGMHHAWVTLFAVTVFSWLPWALATPLVLWLGRRYTRATLKAVPLVLLHATVCATIAAVYSAWTSLLEIAFNPYLDSDRPLFPTLWFGDFSNAALSSLVLYGGILAVSYALRSRERLAFEQAETARLNEQLSRAQLDALRRQIEPHFLFNTLNAIAGLVRSGQADSAVDMIAALSDFLRRILDDVARQQVTLRDEIAFARTYLDIQKVRFADRLQLRVDVPAELGTAQVPSLILQPLIENAVKHGIAKRAGGGEIAISAARHNGTLTLTVCNDGPQLPEDWATARSRIGIANVRSRLESLYGAAFELQLRNQRTGGVAASVSLPFVLAPPPKDP